MKQLRYSGVKDHIMKDTPAHKQIRRTRLKASHFIRDHSCRLSCEYEHGPTHAQVQTT